MLTRPSIIYILFIRILLRKNTKEYTAHQYFEILKDTHKNNVDVDERSISPDNTFPCYHSMHSL